MINLPAWESGLWVGLAALPLGLWALVLAHVKPKLPLIDSGWCLVWVWLMAGGMAASFGFVAQR